MTAGSHTEATAQQPLRLFDSYPRSAAVAAAVGLSSTAVFRCLYALPILWWLARRENGIFGSRPWRARRWPLLAGIFFGVDLLLFHQSVLLMGAGLASVMSNLQVVIVLIAAWIIWNERPSLTQAIGIPIALVGILLISGVAGGGAYGDDPILGSILGVFVAITYAGYLLLMRKGRDRRRAAGPILDATIATTLTGVALVIGRVLLGSAARRKQPDQDGGAVATGAPGL